VFADLSLHYKAVAGERLRALDKINLQVSAGEVFFASSALGLR